MTDEALIEVRLTKKQWEEVVKSIDVAWNEGIGGHDLPLLDALEKLGVPIPTHLQSDIEDFRKHEKLEKLKEDLRILKAFSSNSWIVRENTASMIQTVEGQIEALTRSLEEE